MCLVKIHCIKGSFGLAESGGVSGFVLLFVSGFFLLFFDQTSIKVISLSLF